MTEHRYTDDEVDAWREYQANGPEEPRHLDYSCLACSTDFRCLDDLNSHPCPDRDPAPPTPKPFVRRWDPVGAIWLQCMVEHGKAWCPATGTYTEVKPEELANGLR